MALKKITVKPNSEKEVNGKRIQPLHPFQPRPLKEAGEEVLDCPKVRNMLRDGDIVRCDEKNPAPKKGSEEPLHQAKNGETHQPKKKASKQPKKKTVDSGDSET
jgi:hypothetical protein